MRHSWIAIVAGVCAVACASRQTPGDSDTPAGWYCFADRHGGGSTCTRSIAACEQDSAAWIAAGDPGNPNTSTRCAPQGLAYCYSWVPENGDGDGPTTACLISQASCQASAAYTRAREGTMTACTATP
jgi:hypothetical protein